jgi:hypothetical protein
MHIEKNDADFEESPFCHSVLSKDQFEEHSGSEESDVSAGSGSDAPPGAGQSSDRDERAGEAHTVPEGGGASYSPALPTLTPFCQSSFGAQATVIDEPIEVLRNGVLLEVTKRDGRLQPLKVFKLRERINRLMKGLNHDFVFPELIVQKVLLFHVGNVQVGKEKIAFLKSPHCPSCTLAGCLIITILSVASAQVVAGAYNKVKTEELDSLMAETAAYVHLRPTHTAQHGLSSWQSTDTLRVPPCQISSDRLSGLQHACSAGFGVGVAQAHLRVLRWDHQGPPRVRAPGNAHPLEEDCRRRG